MLKLKERQKEFCRNRCQRFGIGTTIKKIDKLFHAFTQADASTTRKYGGQFGSHNSVELARLMGRCLC